MLMAHPSLGWVELSPEQIQESAPDGFEVILVDRTSTTPEAKFNSVGLYQPSAATDQVSY